LAEEEGVAEEGEDEDEDEDEDEGEGEDEDEEDSAAQRGCGRGRGVDSAAARNTHRRIWRAPQRGVAGLAPAPRECN
jgi:hypothetical protein